MEYADLQDQIKVRNTIHTIFNVRAGATICNFNVWGASGVMLVILPVQKQSALQIFICYHVIFIKLFNSL